MKRVGQHDGGCLSEAYGEPQDYESWEDVYRVWNEELDKAAARRDNANLLDQSPIRRLSLQ